MQVSSSQGLTTTTHTTEIPDRRDAILRFPLMRVLPVDLHRHDVLTAVDYAHSRVREAFENGYNAVELQHGAGDVTEPVESGRGRIKWALRKMVEDGQLDSFIDRGRTWFKSTSMVLYLRPNPRPRRERWAPEPPRTYR
jgi:hypothetical protein